MSAASGIRTGGLVACAALFLFCGDTPETETRERSAEEMPFLADGTPPAEFDREGDASPPARFGMGRTATPEEIARVDIDVMPDGTGLPAGEGSVHEGREIYATRCAACHGSEGEGASAGALVAEGDPHAFVAGDHPGAFGRRTVGNYWPYATTLFDYVRRTMPFDRPGSLEDSEVYAVVAWILWRNDLIEEDAVMTASSLPRVEMPARDRFVPDDRLSSTRTR